MNDKVSVIIPTYKRSEFLDRAIQSVLVQTYTNIEIVVVDDNNPNTEYRVATENQMAKYEKNSKVRYIKNHCNTGGALARNVGINMATGGYIAFLDDDDVYLPQKIENQIEYMKKMKLDMSFTDVRIYNQNDKLIDYRQHRYVKDLSNDELLKQHIMHHLTPTGTYIYKKQKLIEIGCFDNATVGQEFRLMIKTIESGMKIGYIPKADVVQYVHDGERISVGQGKLEGEKQIFQLKMKYFNQLSKKQINYVKFRYHAVIGVVGFRSKKYDTFLKNIVLAFFISPINCLSEVISHLVKIQRNKE